MLATSKTPLPSIVSALTPALFAAVFFHPATLHPQILPRIQPADITCDSGDSQYSYRFSSGVTVSVGAPLNSGFAERTCAASLDWGSHHLSVDSNASQIVIDVLGADIGLGKPVVAFQIDDTGDGIHRTYQIYSLAKPPRLLYTIHGADSYVAADARLDGEIEIWADDARALDGLEGVPFKSWDFAPTVVLDFEKRHLVNVSSRFPSHYDSQIARVRARLLPADLSLFRNSDGILAWNDSAPNLDLHRLVRTKIKVLEIVCAYLYSGRDAQAWSTLQQMWPPKDLDRIRARLLAARQNGILRGIPNETEKPRHRRQAHIYDATGQWQETGLSVFNPEGGPPNLNPSEPSVIQPKAILLRTPPPPEVGDFQPSHGFVELVVDAAGKVHSVKLLSGAGNRWLKASAGWHFVPALHNGRPVACRFRVSVWDLK